MGRKCGRVDGSEDERGPKKHDADGEYESFQYLGGDGTACRVFQDTAVLHCGGGSRPWLMCNAADFDSKTPQASIPDLIRNPASSFPRVLDTDFCYLPLPFAFCLWLLFQDFYNLNRHYHQKSSENHSAQSV